MFQVSIIGVYLRSLWFRQHLWVLSPLDSLVRGPSFSASRQKTDTCELFLVYDIYISKCCPWWPNDITAEGVTVEHIQVCVSLTHFVCVSNLIPFIFTGSQRLLENPLEICRSMCAHHSTDLQVKVSQSHPASTLWDQCALIWRKQLLWSDNWCLPSDKLHIK